MKISIISVFPELYTPFLQLSLIARAVERGLIEFNLVRFSDMCQPKERIDEPTVGPGAGMILKPEVVQRAIEICEKKWGSGYKIFFSPQGIKLDQQKVQAIADCFIGLPKAENVPSMQPQLRDHIILVCPRYEGVDVRVEEHYADLIVSIGDYVVMGGDLPAQVFLEAFLRLIPGVVGSMESVTRESFQAPFLDHPEYGLPVVWEGKAIPEIVRSGNHGEIARWRREQACKKTIERRFDWFVKSNLQADDVELARKYIPPHYVALMHTDVELKGGRVGTTSVASLDIHDTARACSTYGVSMFFIVTPLIDQQEIIRTFLNFWGSEVGQKYNKSRSYAVSSVKVTPTFEDLVAEIEQREGKKPLIITTSARAHDHGVKIDYGSQAKVWAAQRPVLFVFGTGQGLSKRILDSSDYLLVPIEGLTCYNHLSVRSAVSILLDRWLGLHPENCDRSF